MPPEPKALAFSPIVVAGAQAAEPHGHAGDYRIKSGDTLLFDFGATADGYNADITRTVFVGEPDADARALYETVYAANKLGREFARPGVTAGAVDDTVLSFLEKSRFVEGDLIKTGHGLGLDVHEAPQIMRGNDTVLEAWHGVHDRARALPPGPARCADRRRRCRHGNRRRKPHDLSTRAPRRRLNVAVQELRSFRLSLPRRPSSIPGLKYDTVVPPGAVDRNVAVDHVRADLLRAGAASGRCSPLPRRSSCGPEFRLGIVLAFNFSRTHSDLWAPQSRSTAAYQTCRRRRPMRGSSTARTTSDTSQSSSAR